jgi:hypothetical protein
MLMGISNYLMELEVRISTFHLRNFLHVLLFILLTCLVVYADNGSGQIFNKSLIKEGDGLYYHVAMENGHANQVCITKQVNTKKKGC